jgi:glyoxylase-like metal-dependent hydrolase (beta-lactamase superfamily II)
VDLQIKLLVTGSLEENCYLLWSKGGNEAAVIDPGDEAGRIDAALKKLKLRPAALLLTHCHGDHIGAVQPLKELHPQALIYAPAEEAQWLQRPALNLSYFVGAAITCPPADCLVRGGDELKVAGLALRAIHVPGHTPGGTAFYVAGSPPHLFCGDILFAGGIGRTDLPGGSSQEALVKNIREKLFVLPPETVVHPGHGPESTIGEEQANNPYCGKYRGT